MTEQSRVHRGQESSSSPAFRWELGFLDKAWPTSWRLFVGHKKKSNIRLDCVLSNVAKGQSYQTFFTGSVVEILC